MTFLLTAEILIFTGDFDILPVVNKDIQKTLGMYLEDKKKHSIRSLNPHVDIYVDSLQINFRQRQYEPLSVGHIEERNRNDYGKNDEYKDTGTHIYKENRTDGICCPLSL